MSNSLANRRIGAYGGTFDPIHNGHIQVARSVLEHFRLDHLLIIPAARPPHKNPQAILDSYHRYAMAVLATQDIPGISVSTLELEAPERPYTYETIERLNQIYGPDTRLFFIIGADSFEELHTWRHPGRLLAGADLVVATRPGYRVDPSTLPPGMDSGIIDLRGQPADPSLKDGSRTGTIYLTDYVVKEESSTEIRRRVREGLDTSRLVPPGVSEYIRKYGLYTGTEKA